MTRCSARRRRRAALGAAQAAPRDDVTFGGGTKADGATSNRILASRAPAGKHRQPAVGLAARRGDDALGHLALEHQHQRVVPGRPWLGGQPADQERGGDIVGQVGDDAGRVPDRDARRGSNVKRVACNDVEPARIMPGDLLQRRDRRARSRSIAMTRRAPSASSARVRPPGPGPISTTVTSSSGPAARAMRAVRLRSSRKFWPSDFLASGHGGG